jgi:hypothetical protein
MPILFAEGAASFEDLALNNQLGALKVQVKDAWPNLFRQARFLSAVDFVQADRLRRKVASRWRASSRTWTCSSCRRSGTSNSRSRTSPAILAHAARRIRRGVRSAERLGARSGEPAAEVQSAAARAARDHDRRPVVR